MYIEWDRDQIIRHGPVDRKRSVPKTMNSSVGRAAFFKKYPGDHCISDPKHRFLSPPRTTINRRPSCRGVNVNLREMQHRIGAFQADVVKLRIMDLDAAVLRVRTCRLVFLLAHLQPAPSVLRSPRPAHHFARISITLSCHSDEVASPTKNLLPEVLVIRCEQQKSRQSDCRHNPPPDSALRRSEDSQDKSQKKHRECPPRRVTEYIAKQA